MVIAAGVGRSRRWQQAAAGIVGVVVFARLVCEQLLALRDGGRCLRIGLTWVACMSGAGSFLALACGWPLSLAFTAGGCRRWRARGACRRLCRWAAAGVGARVAAGARGAVEPLLVVGGIAADFAVGRLLALSAGHCCFAVVVKIPATVHGRQLFLCACRGHSP